MTGLVKNEYGILGHGNSKSDAAEMNLWTELIFSILIQIQESLKLFNNFWKSVVKIICSLLGQLNLKPTVS